MGVSQWPVEPKQRVGPFMLGMGVNEAVAVVQKMGSLDRAELSFDEQHPFDTDLSLRMPSLGLQLCFDGFQQDLRVIAVRLAVEETEERGTREAEEMPVMLPPFAYGGRIFAGAQQSQLCLRDVCTMFGPTYIGDFQSGAQAAYFLRYPGITFEFPLPEDLVGTLAARGEHPMELPGRPAPTAVRMWVFAEDSLSFSAPASALPDVPEAVLVRPATGVELRGRVLRFGSMPQDVFSDFGPPEQVCVKDVDAVRIHSARALPSRLAGPDYYYNYFHLGLDVLFDGLTHLVKKVILHTNPPTHELFSRYSRCFFQIPIEATVHAASQASPVLAPAEEAPPPQPVLRNSQTGPPTSPPQHPVPAALLQPAPASGLDAPRPVLEEECPQPADALQNSTADVDATSEGVADEDESQVRRKLSKRERKAGRKGKKRAPLGTPPLQEASPLLSVPSTSPEPSPLPAELDDTMHTASALPSDALCFEEELLPPPALPLDGDRADAQSLILHSATPCSRAQAAAEGQSSGWGSQMDVLELEPKVGGGACPRSPGCCWGQGSCGQSPVDGDAETFCIDVRWHWSEIQQLLSNHAGVSCGKPLIVSQNGHTPFGSTYFYALPGLAFEVMQNGGLASLTVFSVPREELPAAFVPSSSGSRGSRAIAATRG